jgi:hypothetical protein
VRALKKCKQRCYDAGPAFANKQHKHDFRRFMLNGKQKVAIETVYCCWRTIFEKRPSQISIKQPEKRLQSTNFLILSINTSIKPAKSLGILLLK